MYSSKYQLIQLFMDVLQKGKKTNRRIGLQYLLLLMIFVGPAQANQGISWTKLDNDVTGIVDWCTAHNSGNLTCKEDQGESTDKPRVTENDRVKFIVRNFNFLHFNLESKVDETTIESYGYLADLWGQLLDPSSIALGFAPDPKVTWWKEINDASFELKTFLSNYTGSSILNANQVGAIESKADSYPQVLKKLEALRSAAYANISSASEISNFRQIDSEHQIMVNAISNFIALANKSVDGESLFIGKKGKGTFVSVTLNASARPSSLARVRVKPITVDYLSESKFPLVFHVGLTYSQLNDAEFETVRSLRGRDLFSAIREEENTESLSLFASYPLDKKNSNEAKWFATLGTDIDDLGENIYLGVSRKVKEKWFVSAGGAYGLQAEGISPAPEGMDVDEPTRQLFKIVKEERDWEFFVSVSVKFY